MTEEGDWVRAACQGDAQAWEQLVQIYQQPIFRLAYLLLGDADDAEDVAQETLIRAYRSLGSFDPSRPLRPWLLRITANLSHNWRRSAGRSLMALQRLFRRELPPEPPSQLAEQEMEAEMLWQAVRQLSQADQQVIYLRFFLDCPEAETAQVLGVAVGTVKSRQHRALARLRAVLEKDYPQWIKEGSDVIL